MLSPKATTRPSRAKAAVSPAPLARMLDCMQTRARTKKIPPPIPQIRVTQLPERTRPLSGSIRKEMTTQVR